MNPLHEAQESLLPSVWGSSPTFSILPRRLGIRRSKASAQTAPAGYALLYPPYTWIPASAGMTGHGAAGRCREFEGVPQLPFFLPPGMGDKGG